MVKGDMYSLTFHNVCNLGVMLWSSYTGMDIVAQLVAGLARKRWLPVRCEL